MDEEVKLTRRLLLQSVGGLGTLSLSVSAGRAQAYPSRPVTIVVPYAAGSPTDIVARVILDKMQAPLGQSIVVENVSGAGGSLGAIRGMRAAPDGYTICFGNNGSHVLSAALYAMPFDLLTDIAPISRVTTNSQIITSNKAIPASNLKELIAWLKDRKVLFGVAGPMASVSVLSFQNMTGGQFQLVPYRGTVAQTQDLISGQIEMVIDQVSSATPLIKAGSIKAYAVAARTRSPTMPDIPTVDEAGLPGFYGSIWTGAWAPKGTPKDIIAKIAGAVRVALADPAVKERMSAIGQEIVPVDQQTPEALAAYQKAEIEKWVPLAKAANLKGE